MRKCFVILAILVFATNTFADGGRLRLRENAGPFIVTLFTTPDPLRQGRADFSVAVERAGSGGLVENARVTVILTPMGSAEKPIVLHLSRAAATSKFLQAANFNLPHPGNWQITIEVQKGAETGSCSGEIPVLPPALLNSQLTWDIAAVPFVALLFLLHQWRKSRYLRSRVIRKRGVKQGEPPLVTISNASGQGRR
jgi:hypothetical protein